MEPFEREVKPIISSLARGSGESTHLLAATSIRHSGIEQDRYAHHPAHQARTLSRPCLPSFCRCELRARVGCERGWCCSARKHRNVLPSLLLPSPTCACAVLCTSWSSKCKLPSTAHRHPPTSSNHHNTILLPRRPSHIIVLPYHRPHRRPALHNSRLRPQGSTIPLISPFKYTVRP